MVVLKGPAIAPSMPRPIGAAKLANCKLCLRSCSPFVRKSTRASIRSRDLNFFVVPEGASKIASEVDADRTWSA